MSIITVAYIIVLQITKERRDTLHIGVWIGVYGRRVPGQIVLPGVLDGKVLIAVRQQSVMFADIVIIQFKFQDRQLGSFRIMEKIEASA
jgi:hypothetical protein